MVKTSLSHNNNNNINRSSNNNSNNVTSVIKESATVINGKNIKPHISNNGAVATTKSILSSSSQTNSTVQNHKEVRIHQNIEFNNVKSSMRNLKNADE